MYLAEKLVWPKVTFNDIEGQNHIAYDATAPNMSMHAKIKLNGAAVKPVKRHEHRQIHTDTLREIIS